MSDPFIDRLHDRLGADRQQRGEGHEERRFADAKDQWWAQFIDVLGQKVGAWNEKGHPGGPVNFTKRTSGGAQVWHPTAEAELRLEGDRVLANARFGTAQPVEGTLIQLSDGSDGRIVAVADNEPLHSPTEAAEKVITPILTHVFQHR